MTDAAKQRFLAAKERAEAFERLRESIETPFREEMIRTVAECVAMKGEEAALIELDEARDACPDYRGKCETCDVDLFEGDTGFVYADDAIYYCAEHAPDYEYVLQNAIESGPYEETDEEHAERIEALKTHDPKAKCVWPL